MKKHEAVALAVLAFRERAEGSLSQQDYALRIQELAQASGVDSLDLAKKADALNALRDAARARKEEAGKKSSPPSEPSNSVGAGATPPESTSRTAEEVVPFLERAVVVPDDSGVLPFAGEPGASYLVARLPPDYRVDVPPSAIISNAALRATLMVTGVFHQGARESGVKVTDAQAQPEPQKPIPPLDLGDREPEKKQTRRARRGALPA